MKLPGVFLFSDYRRYIQTYYEARKSSTRDFSYRVLAEKAGTGSASHLQMVVSGQRNLTIKAIHALARAMRLNHHEHEYFEALVLHDQADEAAEKRYYKKRMQRLKSLAPRDQTKLSHASVLVADPMFPAVIVLSVALSELGEAPVSLIAERLGIGEHRVSSIINESLKMGLTRKASENRYEISSDHVDYSDTDLSHTQRRFLKNQIEFTLQKFEECYGRGGKFFSTVLTIGEERDAEVHARIEALMNSVSTDFDSDSNSDKGLFQLNIQLFPLVSSIGKKENSE